jgi:hypothetical protein
VATTRERGHLADISVVRGDARLPVGDSYDIMSTDGSLLTESDVIFTYRKAAPSGGLARTSSRLWEARCSWGIVASERVPGQPSTEMEVLTWMAFKRDARELPRTPQSTLERGGDVES